MSNKKNCRFEIYARVAELELAMGTFHTFPLSLTMLYFSNSNY